MGGGGGCPQSNELRLAEWLLTHYKKVQQEVSYTRSHTQLELKIHQIAAAGFKCVGEVKHR